jgi:hypothetical protein
MAGIFRVGEENTAARYGYRARISTQITRKGPPSRMTVKILDMRKKPQSFQLGSLRPGQRRSWLTVITPLRSALLAGTQIAGAQRIPFGGERL